MKITGVWASSILAAALAGCGAAPDESAGDDDGGVASDDQSDALMACGKFDPKWTFANDGCAGSIHNCKIRKYRDDPATKNVDEGDGPFRLKNRKTGKMLFHVEQGTVVHEGGHGWVTGTILPHARAGEPGCGQGPCVKLNLGQRRDIYGKPHYYAWVVQTDQGIRSGWIAASSLVDEPHCFKEQNHHTPSDDGEADYVIHPSNDAPWIDQNGHPYVLHLDSCGGPGSRATDYLARGGNLVNFSWTLPGFGLGTGSVDTVSNNSGVVFHRYTAVKHLETRFYDCATHAHRDMWFYYGRINGVRGWMATPNITKP